MPTTAAVLEEEEETRAAQPTFQIRTGAMKAAEGEGGDLLILVTASSTEVDLEGDRFMDSALQEMQRGFTGLTIFLNHKYDVPESVFGTVTQAYLVERDGYTDLDLQIRVCQESTRAIEAYKMIKSGVRLGVSVGVMVDDVNKSDTDKYRGRAVIEIGSTIPLEASVVGIPANRRSWVQDAVVGLVECGMLEVDGVLTDHRPWLVKALKKKKVGVKAPLNEKEETPMPKTKAAPATETPPRVLLRERMVKDLLLLRGDTKAVDMGTVGDLAVSIDEAVDQLLKELGIPDADADDKSAKAHDAFTGTHSHEHTAAGTQGSDETHDHEHSHDGDASHDHTHEDAADPEETAEGEGTEEKSCCGNPGAADCCLDANGEKKAASVLPDILRDAFTESMAMNGFVSNFWDADWALYSALCGVLKDNGDEENPVSADDKVNRAAAAVQSFGNFVSAAFEAAARAIETSGDNSLEFSLEEGLKGAIASYQKSGARNAKKDAERIQGVHDITLELGATCAADEVVEPKAGEEGETTDTKQYGEVVELLKTTTARLADVVTEQERQAEEIASKDETLSVQGDIIKELLELPLPRKAVVRGETVDTDVLRAKVGSIYDESIVRRLSPAEKK